MTRLDEILAWIIAQGRVSSSDLVAHFGISRQAVHRYLSKLRKQGLIIKSGATRGASYSLATPHGLGALGVHEFRRPFPAEDAVYRELVEPAVGERPKRLVDIVHYTLTEVFNNALEHSNAESISLRLFGGEQGVAFEVADDGIGCFENVRRTHQLEDLREAIEQLSKGKVTTMPDAHSGEGLFFTSKVATRFGLQSNELNWRVDNLRNDMAIGPSETVRGTHVEIFVSPALDVGLDDVFRRYTSDDFAFDRTSVRIRLFERGEVFMSRSEAKRVVAGLDRFERVIFDFEGVRMVGQGFVDQIFRVFAKERPEVRLSVLNANDTIAFMIRRGAPTVEFV
jgi:biotin operon repressor